MAALQDALKSLAAANYEDIPHDDLKSYLSTIFSDSQFLVDSVPIPEPAEPASSTHSRSNSVASNASEIIPSSARSAPPPDNVAALQKEWGKPIKMKPAENPLGISVYKLAGKDGKGAWFARRSVHEGISFSKFKKGLQKEFPETLKVQGPPGEGNIRGIGGERRVEDKLIALDGDEKGRVGKMEVYHLSAQFPGPTTPRDFVTLLLTSDQVVEDRDVPRHFMIVSKPCIHPDCPEREGFIRGSYQSVEFVREIPLHKKNVKRGHADSDPQVKKRGRASSTLSKEAVLRNAKKHGEPSEAGDHDEEDAKKIETARARGKTISFAESRGEDAKGEKVDNPDVEEEEEMNPVEWIMITRSDPGGSVPRFMVERGTPGGIVNDASKFLNWACSKDMDDLADADSEDTPDADQNAGDKTPVAAQNTGLKRPQGAARTPSYARYNGHLAGIDGSSEAEARHERNLSDSSSESPGATDGGIYGMLSGAVASASQSIASHLPGGAPTDPTASASTSSFQHEHDLNIARIKSARSHHSLSSSSSSSSSSFSSDSFVSAAEGYPSDTETGSSAARVRAESAQEEVLRKLEAAKQKLDAKLAATREKELSKQNEDKEKEEAALKKAEEKHCRQIEKQDEKHRKQLAKIEAKRLKEERKASERRKKVVEKDEVARLKRERDELLHELQVVRVEKDILTSAVGRLQGENTALAARIGALAGSGATAEKILREVREGVEEGKGARGASTGGGLKGLRGRSESGASGRSLRRKENSSVV